MKQLTLRGFDSQLAVCLQQVADARALSLNKAALYLMRKGAGLETEARPARIGHTLDHLIGIWSKADEDEFEESTREFSRVDDELWA